MKKTNSLREVLLKNKGNWADIETRNEQERFSRKFKNVRIEFVGSDYIEILDLDNNTYFIQISHIECFSIWCDRIKKELEYELNE